MKEATALSRLTNRANKFLGMTFEQYIIKFTYVNDGRLILNDNGSMQKAFEVWVSFNNREQKLIEYHERRA